MYTIVSEEHKGFYKIKKDGIQYNVSVKKFAELEDAGEISKTPQSKKNNSNEGNDSGNSNDDNGKKAKTSDKLSDLKKDHLVEIAKRMGFDQEITNQITKAVLIEFIEEKQKAAE